MFAKPQGEILGIRDESRTLQFGLAGVLALAALVRGAGISYGLPFLYDPDEAVFVLRAGSILANRDLNPHFFGHPGTTTIYLLSALYTLIYLAGSLSGAFRGVQDFKAAYYQNPTLFYLSGRILFALIGIASVFLLYRTVKRAFGSGPGLLSALILAVSPMHAEISRLIRTDILMSFLLIVVLWYCLEILEKHDTRSHVLAGFFLGLAVVTKYPAAIGASMIIVAAFEGRTRVFAAFRRLVLSGASCVFGMFLGSPFLFIDRRTALSDFRGENLSSILGGTGEGFPANLIWYVRGPLLHDFSIFGLLLLAAGAAALIRSGRRKEFLFAVFPLLFGAFIAAMRIRWPRWIVPLVPFAAVLIAVGFDRALARLKSITSARWGGIAAVPLSALLILPMVRLDFLGCRMAGHKDTRTVAREWILKHVPRGSRLLVEEYTCQLPKNDYTFFIIDRAGNCVPADVKNGPEAVYKPPPFFVGRLADADPIRKWNIEYLVLGNWMERFGEDSRRFPESAAILENYRRIMESGTKIYEVNRIPYFNQGPTVRVIRMRTGPSPLAGSMRPDSTGRAGHGSG
jgi:hypothetical protein